MAPLICFPLFFSPLLRSCKGPESLHMKTVWCRPQVGHVMGKKLVRQPLALRDVHLAELQRPDAPPGQLPLPAAPQALEDEGLRRLVYEGWRREEAGGSWSAWQHYEVPLPPQTHRTKGCESSVIQCVITTNTAAFLTCSWYNWFCSECLIPCFNRKFDQDLESVSRGLKRLKHLSKAFDDLIGRDDR